MRTRRKVERKTPSVAFDVRHDVACGRNVLELEKKKAQMSWTMAVGKFWRRARVRSGRRSSRTRNREQGEEGRA